MGVWSKIAKGAMIGGAGLATAFTGGAAAPLLGAAIGAASKSSAQNRDAQYSGQMDLAKLLADRDEEMQRLRANADNDFTSNQVAREQEGRLGRSDAWRKLLSAQHVMNPTAMPNVSPYAAPQRQPTAATMQGGDALTQEVMARLQGGNPIAAVEKRTPKFDYDPMSTIDPGLLKAGMGEKLGGILGPILSGIGGLGRKDDEDSRNTGYGGGITKGGAPVMSATDLAFLRSQNPRFIS